MAKFAIECPVCGKYAEAKTGFFAKKKIDCSCGNVINIRTDKLASRECPHCGNQVVFDQTKGADAVCPICNGKINTMAEQQKVEEFSCAQCGVRLMTTRSASTYVCPVCDYMNDVQERLTSEKIKRDGLASVIKYEGDNNTFIWKHPIEDFNYGSQLIVHESQEAIFFKDGQALDLFGPGRYTLETQQLPLLEKTYQLPTDTEGTFHSEVYFINKTVQMAIKWGTPDKVRFIDPLTGTPLQIGASGELNLQVSNSRKLLIKLVGTTKGIAWEEGPGLTKSIQNSFRPLISSTLKTNLSSVITNEAIDLLEIDSKLDIISTNLREKLIPGFEEYGLTIPQFYVTNIVLPEDDPNFKRIKELHTITLQTRMLQAEATVRTAKAQSETIYRTAEEQSKAAIEAAHRAAVLEQQTTETEIAKREAERRVIEAQAEAQAARMQGLTEAEIMAAKGYSQKDVLTAEVQKAYAEGIGNMGPAISAGGGSSIVGDMMGLGVGLAAASAISPQIGQMMNNFGNMGQGNNQQMSVPAYITNPVQPQNMAEAWDCACGHKGIIGNFCNNCGAKKPMLVQTDTWDCSCGQTGVIGNFCNNCGAKRPMPVVSDTWNCACGQSGITGNFCSNCGAKRGE
ncbi:MAG: SPFH domain-containing protein [Lachnospiraceae bacterium]|nr:SPFH domain-containing protein [Lachnospiraceae bacterium]